MPVSPKRPGRDLHAVAIFKSVEAEIVDLELYRTERRTDRRRREAVAMHLALEACGLRQAALASALGCSRQLVSVRHQLVWDRRDQDPEFDRRMWALTEKLKEGQSK
ncbi:MAG: hypothetical protein AAFY82_00210 [Pseudomonadota bacterium]